MPFCLFCREVAQSYAFRSEYSHLEICLFTFKELNAISGKGRKFNQNCFGIPCGNGKEFAPGSEFFSIRVVPF